MTERSARLLPVDVTAGAPVPLPPHSSLVIGRDPSVDLPLPDGDVSRRHAEVEGDGSGWRVRDLGSGNGTFVNGRRIEERRLRSGDEVRFGAGRRYRFLVDGAAERAGSGLLLSLVRHELAPRDPDEDPGPVSIGSAPILVGRSDRADLRLSHHQISDLHARVETHGGRPWIHDARSRNGTWVNGDRVGERILRPGDEVAFADRAYDVRLGRMPSARGLVVTAAAAVVVLVALVGTSLLERRGAERESLWTRQMYEERAEQSLAEAVDAYDRAPPAVEVARARFDIAVRSLIAADRLRPDVQTPEELRVAFAGATRRVGDRLGGRDPYDIYRSLTVREVVRPIEPPDPGQVVERELSRILAEFGIDTKEQPIPPDLLAEVDRFVDFWTVRKRDYTRRAIRRAQPHMELIETELRAAHLPAVFSHLPFVESGYQTRVTSSAGAGGIWQFMPKTARSYGLRVDDDVDERTDPALSTRAACRYLDGLLSAFGADAFMCAVAAYNKGEYGMVTCLKRISWRSKWKFWELVQRKDGCLKQETIEYVPRFLAAAIVMRRPEAFGLGDSAADGEI